MASVKDSKPQIAQIVAVCFGSGLLFTESIIALYELGKTPPGESSKVRDQLNQSWIYDTVYYSSVIVSGLTFLLTLVAGICYFTKYADKFNWLGPFMIIMMWIGSAMIFAVSIMQNHVFYKIFVTDAVANDNGEVSIPVQWVKWQRMYMILAGLSAAGLGFALLYTDPGVFGLQAKS